MFKNSLFGINPAISVICEFEKALTVIYSDPQRVENHIQFFSYELSDQNNYQSLLSRFREVDLTSRPDLSLRLINAIGGYADYLKNIDYSGTRLNEHQNHAYLITGVSRMLRFGGRQVPLYANCLSGLVEKLIMRWLEVDNKQLNIRYEIQYIFHMATVLNQEPYRAYFQNPMIRRQFRHSVDNFLDLFESHALTNGQDIANSMTALSFFSRMCDYPIRIEMLRFLINELDRVGYFSLHITNIYNSLVEMNVSEEALLGSPAENESEARQSLRQFYASNREFFTHNSYDVPCFFTHNPYDVPCIAGYKLGSKCIQSIDFDGPSLQPRF